MTVSGKARLEDERDKGARRRNEDGKKFVLRRAHLCSAVADWCAWF